MSSSSQLVPATSFRNACLFGSNAVANFAGIVGVSVWASAGAGWWGFSSAYGFYWFTVITSFLVSSFGASFFGCGLVPDRVEFFPALTNVIWVVVEGIYAIFTLSAGASVAQLSTGCRALENDINNLLSPYGDYATQQIGVPRKLCDGMIVSAVFGFVSFALWTALAALGSIDVYRQFNTEAPVISQTVTTVTQSTNDVETPAQTQS